MNVAVVLSGGVGSRMGIDRPKQYVLVNNKPVISYCLKTFFENEMTDAILIGVSKEWEDYVCEIVDSFQCNKPVYYSLPGETRQLTIFNALNVLRELNLGEEDVVLIHDAARPMVSHDLINRCFESCKLADGVMPVVPVKDTTYLSSDGLHIDSLLNRNHLWGGQAPEAFKFGPYLRVHNQMTLEELLQITGSTEIAYRAGLKCIMVKGDPMNIKITTLEDLSTFESIVTGVRD